MRRTVVASDMTTTLFRQTGLDRPFTGLREEHLAYAPKKPVSIRGEVVMEAILRPPVLSILTQAVDTMFHVYSYTDVAGSTAPAIRWLGLDL